MATFIMHDRGDMSPFLEDDVVAELPWEPVERYVALAEADALERAVARARRPSKEAIGLPPSARSLGDSVVLADMEFLLAVKQLGVSAATLSHAEALELEDRLGVPRGKIVQMMRAEEPRSPCEYTYDPVRRYNALAHTFKQPRGAKGLEEHEILRQSNPCYGSLMPRRERPNAAELSYEPMSRYASLAKSLKRPRGFKTAEHLEILRTSDPCYGSLTPLRERPNAAELPYEPMRRFAALAKTLKPLRGAKTTEHLAILRLSDPTYGSLTPLRERPNAAELPYEPMRRFNALAKTLKVSRGAKTTEHLAILRLSDPTYGSLTPLRERPNAAELPYEPMRRFNALAKHFKTPRGSKTVAHLKVLRTSDPCSGSLAPQRERPNAAELPYAPHRRFNALARLLKEPKGAKPFEHLRNLRLSDPSLGSLAPRRAADALDDEDEDEVQAAAVYEARYLRARTTSSSFGSGKLSSFGSGRLPRILSNQAFEPLEDDDDELSLPSPSPRDEPPARGARGGWAPPAPTRNPTFYRELPSHSARRYSSDENESGGECGSERDSMRSAARTSLERMSERSSNDTIASFLDDHDALASGDFSGAAARDFRMELKAELGEGLYSPKMPAPAKRAAPGAASAAGFTSRHKPADGAAKETPHAAAPLPQRREA